MYVHGVSLRPWVLDSYTQILGEVTNESGQFWDLVGIEVNFYENPHRFIGKTYVAITDFYPGQTRTFEREVEVPLGSIARYEVLTTSTERIGQ